MKSTTKFYILFLALLISLGVMAQMTTEEVKHLRAIEEQEIRDHGPSIDVPYTPNNVNVTGDNCTDPIEIYAFDGMGTWSTTGETTCGRVDDYDATYGTCVNPTYYTNGEDIVYELIVTDDMWLEFNFDPVENYASIWVMEGCPDQYPNVTCIVGKAEYSNAEKIFISEFSAGTYYIQIDSWPSPDCITFDLMIDQAPPPPNADPIENFPYLETFESGLWPTTMGPFAGAEAHAVVSSSAGLNSSYGALLDGNTYLNFYHEYDYNCVDAFNLNFPDHTAQIRMNYTPDGSAGALQLDFDFQQFYSFADYYSWFRVTVDGTVLTEVNSEEQCLNASTPLSDGWAHLLYDLSDFQTSGQNYILIIDFVGKYNYLYYQGGDAVMIDNVHLRYVVDNRTVENQTINNGDSECYDATNTITVAGSGTTVDIMSGGDAIFIAGERIHWKSGFHAHSGSYGHGYITQTGEYCQQPQPMVAVETPPEQEAEIITEIFTDEVDENVSVKIYPNPTLGQFTIDFMGRATTADIILRNFQGNQVLETRCVEQYKQVINISHMPGGMYMIIIKTRKQIITEKIIKNY